MIEAEWSKKKKEYNHLRELMTSTLLPLGKRKFLKENLRVGKCYRITSPLGQVQEMRYENIIIILRPIHTDIHRTQN